MLWVHGIYVVLYKSYLKTVCTVHIYGALFVYTVA